ncbi:ABC transporter substrate-binding protein [Tepidibacillus fermentans]|uniref:Putative ABC transport system substrate-binding protein n=1 Tax=Tepidibacillus fermentans TaxID=1281767 RepID=A0A4R3KGI1_9BACI|nr:ABC transporter substrate-binding protein [Tepidibacillus fermentans]TCS82447.1 putative ABC transport system substrate-binding protein [Tepidibacillus fermentans]
MKRFAWVTVIVSVLFFSFLGFQQWKNQSEAKEQFRIGILLSGPERLEKVKGLKDGLQNLGYIEGMNVTYTIKDAKNNVKLMERYASELDRMNLDVIVAGGAIEAKFFKENKGGKTPVIFLGVANAGQLHLVENYKKPEGRMTGVENGHIELSAKRLELFSMLIPSIQNVIVIYDGQVDASLLSLEQVKKIAKEEGIQITPLSISDTQQLETFKKIPLKKDEGILVLPSFYLEEISPQLSQIGLQKKVPIFGVNINDVKNGFLLSYGVSYYDQGYQCASMVSRILQGQVPRDIPVEKPNTVRLLANSLTEKKLNIHFSKSGSAFIQRIPVTEREIE